VRWSTALDPTIGDRVLDLAAGTGTSSQPCTPWGPTSSPRTSPSACSAGGPRASRPPALRRRRRAAPALRRRLFDAVTISFGLRNLSRPGAAWPRWPGSPTGRHARRLLSSATPPIETFRTVYENYLMRALPGIARAVSSAPDAYVYLAESIQDWPDQPTRWRHHRSSGLAVTWSGATSPAGSSRSIAPRVRRQCPAPPRMRVERFVKDVHDLLEEDMVNPFVPVLGLAGLAAAFACSPSSPAGSPGPAASTAPSSTPTSAASSPLPRPRAAVASRSSTT
jgi:demethylmenaquinone methyltransferase / 2-methoxy-6-polyprenyl-1,4-benzoquinol methylase